MSVFEPVERRFVNVFENATLNSEKVLLGRVEDEEDEEAVAEVVAVLLERNNEGGLTTGADKSIVRGSRSSDVVEVDGAIDSDSEIVSDAVSSENMSVC